MKKYTPYIFPLIVIVIVFFLVYRWYSLRTQRGNTAADLNSDIQIENLSPEQLSSVLRGTEDVNTTQLEPATTGEAAPVGRGSIRYVIENGRVNFSVSADLPDSDTAYRVWIRSQNGTDLTEAFMLETSKGGYTGSASIPQDKLPVEVIVSTAAQESEVLTTVLLRGNIAAPEASATPSASPAMENGN